LSFPSRRVPSRPVGIANCDWNLLRCSSTVVPTLSIGTRCDRNYKSAVARPAAVDRGTGANS
jgi:hypothetical protein